MSYLAIGSVTSALAQLLTRKLNKPRLLGSSFTPRVTTLPPDDDRVSEDTGVNLFLYRVAENPTLRNMPWRGDRTHPGTSSRPGLSLTLSYLMTAYSKRIANQVQDDVIAHQVLGDAMAVFNDNPVLNDVHDADFDADVDAMFPPELRDSFDKLKVSLVPIAMEEFSRIWTGLTKAYRLSVAYEVSLLQIGPLAGGPLPAPAVQRPVVTATPIARPVLDSVSPDSGSVGTRVRLQGSGFVSSGRRTTVAFGGVTLDESDLVSLGDGEIVLDVPAGVTRGPVVDVTVSVGSDDSAPARFVVRPWIASLLPMRGMTGVPIGIPIALTATATVSALVDGQAVAAAISADRQLVTVVIPTGLATNGPKPVSLVITDGAALSTNALSYEVLPAIASFTVGPIVNPPATPPRTQVVVSGERLAGADVQLRFGKLLARPGSNATAGSLTFAFDRLLPAIAGPVSVIVDGRESNALPRAISRLEPASGVSSDQIDLVGTSLSGRSVVVHFGAQNVDLHAQPFSSRFTVTVPSGLAAGPVNVSATIDGADTNVVSFTVSA